jgi:hypothetical protein
VLTNTAKSVTSSVQPLRSHLCHTEQHNVLNRDGEGTISQSGLDFERVLVRESPRTSLLSVTTMPTTCGRWRGVRSRPKPRPPGALALGTGLSARGRAHAHAIGASARAASRRQTRGDAAARRTPSSCRLRGFHRTPEAPPCAPILRTRRRRARAHAHRALETRPCGGAAARTRPGCAPYARRWES